LVSLRKRYSPNVESHDKDEPPVAASHVTIDAPNLAEPSEAKAPATNGAADASPPVEKDPVKDAARRAVELQLRLQEMDRAEVLRQEAASQQQQHSTIDEPQQQQPASVEQIISNSGLPELAQGWLRQHPEYVSDPVKNQQLRKMHNVAEYQAGGEYTERYFDRLNVLLGFKQEAAQPAPAPRVAPARRPAYVGAFSAPPTREAPSMKTGRPIERQPQLTRDELEIAAGSGISAEEYARQKAKWEAMKRAGFEDGRDERRR
jgi:hypothetical protein